jgi:hypothetical protein
MGSGSPEQALISLELRHGLLPVQLVVIGLFLAPFL